MYQKCVVVGHLGADPEMRYLPDGTPVASFSVATSRKWTGADGVAKEATTWWRISAWGKVGEVCNQYLGKGKLVLVEGEASASGWVGKDGEARSSLELRANAVKFLSPRDPMAGAAGVSYEDAEEAPF